MIEVRTKDKLFVLIALPLALAALYFFFVRTDRVKRLERLTAQERGLVKEADFPMELRRAENRLESARADLAAERAVPQPVVRVRAKAGASVAEREAEAIAVLREAGLSVAKMDRLEGGDGAALRATGLRPDPAFRIFTLDGGYPAVKKALEMIAEREMAMAVQRLSMDENGRWQLEIVL